MWRHPVLLVLFLLAIFFVFLGSDPAHATLEDTKLAYYSPKSGTFDSAGVTFGWTIHSWDEVLSVTLVITKEQPTMDYSKDDPFVPRDVHVYKYEGDSAKKKKVTITDLDPSSRYFWYLSVTTTDGSGYFGKPEDIYPHTPKLAGFKTK